MLPGTGGVSGLSTAIVDRLYQFWDDCDGKAFWDRAFLLINFLCEPFKIYLILHHGHDALHGYSMRPLCLPKSLVTQADPEYEGFFNGSVTLSPRQFEILTAVRSPLATIDGDQQRTIGNGVF